MPAQERDEFRTALIQNGGDAMRDVIAMYEAEFRAFEDKLYADVTTGKMSVLDMQKRTYDFVVTMRDRSMKAVRSAPDKDFLAYADTQLELMRLASKSNFKACYEMVELGGLSLDTATSMGPDLRAALTRVSAAQAVAARTGAAHPVKREPAGEAEIQLVVHQYGDRNGDMAWLQAMGSKDFSNVTYEQRCHSAIIWVETLRAQPDALAARLLAQ